MNDIVERLREAADEIEKMRALVNWPSANIVDLNVVSNLAVAPLNTFRQAILADLEQVVILGYRKDSGEEFFASSMPDGAEVVWLLERYKHELMSVVSGD